MFDESGGDNKSRVEEARKLIEMIDLNRCPQKDIFFVQSTEERLEQFGDKALISPKQLFWLRDIKDRCL